MKRNDDEGFLIAVYKSEVQNGVAHAEPCDCHEIIQVGAQEKKYLEVINRFLGDLASAHNVHMVGCKNCGWEGFYGPGDKAANEGNKAVVDEGSCPECEGDLIDLSRDTCENESPALDPFYDEEELLPDGK
jgi:hypothetical protein